MNATNGTGRDTTPRTSFVAGQWLGWAWLLLLLTLMAVGGVAIVYRGMLGLSSTYLTNVTPWGTWVAFYIYFVGLSAGAFLLSTLIFVFGMHQLERVGRMALLTALLSMVVALTFILLDLGRMDRFWHPLVFWNLTSVLAWEVHFYVLYIVLLATELYVAMRQDLIRAATGAAGIRRRVARWLVLGGADLSPEGRRQDERWMRILGIIGIPLAIFGVHGGTGALFAVAKARPYWNSGLFPIIFVVSALVSGTALLVVFYAVQTVVRGRALDQDLLQSLARLMIAFLFIDLGLQFYEFLVAVYNLEHEELATLSAMTTGPFWWSFWIVQLGLGALAPIYLVLSRRTRDRPAGLVLAAALVVLGILAVRFNIVVPPLVVPVLAGLPGGDYYPNHIEIASSVGVIAMGLLLYTLGLRWLPVEIVDEGVGSNA